MDAGIEGAERGRAAVEVPVHAIGWRTIRAGLFCAAAAVDEAAHHADFADLAFAEEAVGIDVVRADAAVESDLDRASGILGGADHGTAFIDRVGGGFLDEDVGTGLEGGDGLEGVPVVRGGDDGDVRFFLVEEIAVVAVLFRGRIRDRLDIVRGLGELAGIHVAEGDAFRASGR